MRLPSKKDFVGEWIIGEYTWSVSFVKSIEYGPRNKHLVGITDYYNKSIQLKTKEPKLDTYSTFIHELIHAIDDEYEINLDHDQVYKLEEAMMKFMLANF